MAPLEELDGGWNKVLFACSHEMLMQIQDFLDARKYPGEMCIRDRAYSMSDVVRCDGMLAMDETVIPYEGAGVLGLSLIHI